MNFDNPQTLILRVGSFFVLASVHEYFHAYTALRCGDPTAYKAGRVSLNPLVHIDILGFVMILFGPIGWAKPVPVNPYLMRNPKRDNMLVAFAGPASNLVLGVIFAIIYGLLWKLNLRFDNADLASFWEIVKLFVEYLSFLSFALFFFNLLPFSPLDGGHALNGFIPRAWEESYEKYLRISTVILLALIVLPNMLKIPGIGDLISYLAYNALSLSSGLAIFA